MTTAIRRHTSTSRRTTSRVPRHLVRVSPIRSDADLTAAQARMEALWGAKPGTPTGDELDVLGVLVAAYESAHHQVPGTCGVGTLRAIMDGNGLDQSELPEVGTSPWSARSCPVAGSSTSARSRRWPTASASRRLRSSTDAADR